MTLRKSKRKPEVKLSDMEFADDIVLLENNIHDAQEQLDSLATSAKQVGLNISTSKTEVLTKNVQRIQKLQVNGVELRFVDDFKYLGSYVSGSHEDLKRRKSKAWGHSRPLRVLEINGRNQAKDLSV